MILYAKRRRLGVSKLSLFMMKLMVMPTGSLSDGTKPLRFN